MRAPTGAGKTTRVPPALLDAGLADGRAVVMLEPRRIAARAAARRIARERGTKLGDEVGYRVRFDDVSSKATRILAVTEGVLVRKLQQDPFLDDIGIVIFDEFHERNLLSDLALAMIQRVRTDARDDLKVVVMSATLDPGPIARYLGDCPIVESEGRSFPVEINYLSPADAARERDARTHEIAARGAQRVARATRGNVLVFLPGVGEIRRTQEELESFARTQDVDLLPLYGDLSPKEQDRVLATSDRRKLVLATNVAESSITIDGITSVVDTGLARKLHHEPNSGLNRLRVERISRASADQRAGRAGRTAPGNCLRLWTELDHRSLEAEERPEITRVDLCSAVLELLSWGERDVADFPWFEPPPDGRVARSLELLDQLGAIDDTGGRAGSRAGVTPLGRELARLPIHPRLARLLVESARLGAAREGALAAALLSERDPFPRSFKRNNEPEHWTDSDVVDRVRALDEFAHTRRRRSKLGELAPGAAHFVLDASKQLSRLLGQSLASAQQKGDPDEALKRALFAAFPDRVCRRRGKSDARAVMVGGRGVVQMNESAVREPDFFVAVALEAGDKESRVRLASEVPRDWLAPVVTATELTFDDARERVVATRRTRFRDLVLEEAPAKIDNAVAAARVLELAARERLARALPLDKKSVVAFLTRVRSLAEWMPDLDLPTFDEQELAELLPELCAGRKSFEELRRLPLVDHLKSRLGWERVRFLDREAPETIEVPSGSKIHLTYEPGRPPVLAARIQELFGLRETPRVAGGRVPVLLHLLAPNMRPQQVTDDLESFWNGAYADVRKELRRRYPKHSWPEDPWTAQAMRGARRKRR